MGNVPSTHNPELVDTGIDDWYAAKYNRQGAEWEANQRSTQNRLTTIHSTEAEQRDIDPPQSVERYENDVRENPVLGLDQRKPYDKQIEPLVQTTAAVFHMTNMDQSDEDDDVSMSQRSAAVFEHLEQEANQGNHQPFVKLLETASAVGQMLTGKASADGSERSGGDLFKMLGDVDNVIDVEKIKEGAGDIFELLEKATSVDENHVAQFSSAVFEMLAEARSFSAQPLSERKINIFRMLEENNLREHSEFRSPTSQVREGREEDEYYGSAQFEREDYPEVSSGYVHHNESNDSSTEDVSLLENLPDDSTTTMKRVIPIQTMEGDPIDLVFVQDFDSAFNEFIGQNPRFLLKSPELVHSIRVSKLQKVLAFMSAKERSLLTDAAKLKANKQGMEDSYQTMLREASRGKAARQIYFQAELEKVAMISKTLEAKFKWAVITSAAARTKRHQLLRQRYAEESPDETKDKLVARLPRDIPGENVVSVIRRGPFPQETPMTPSEKSEELKKLQVDVAVITSEVKMWQKKVKIIEAEIQKIGWIESILQQLSEKQMTRLKSRYQKKIGVQFE